MDHSSDPVLGRIGSWGRWQAVTIAVFSLIGFFFGWHMLAVSYAHTSPSPGPTYCSWI